MNEFRNERTPPGAWDRDLRVLVVADRTVVGDAVAVLIGHESGLDLAGRIRPTDDLVAAVVRTDPDVVVVVFGGLRPSPMTLIDAARELRRGRPRIGVVVIADHMTDLGFALLANGTGRVAFLLDHRAPDFASLPAAIQAVGAGGHIIDSTVVEWLVHRPDGVGAGLNAREVDILQRMAGGRSNRAIASELCLSTKSVEKYITSIFRKLHLETSEMTDRRVLATLAFQQGVTPAIRERPNRTPAAVDRRERVSAVGGRERVSAVDAGHA